MLKFLFGIGDNFQSFYLQTPTMDLDFWPSWLLKHKTNSKLVYFQTVKKLTARLAALLHTRAVAVTRKWSNTIIGTVRLPAAQVIQGLGWSYIQYIHWLGQANPIAKSMLTSLSCWLTGSDHQPGLRHAWQTIQPACAWTHWDQPMKLSICAPTTKLTAQQNS